jgi:hypothetical protein
MLRIMSQLLHYNDYDEWACNILPFAFVSHKNNRRWLIRCFILIQAHRVETPPAIE